MGCFSYLIEDVRNKNRLILFSLLVLYFLLNLFKLTSLPVFADEAIYIRWSQLIIDDFARYFFYPMNDGKTPLFMWLALPLLKIFSNQLFAARLLSVLAGAITLIFLYLILRKIKERSAALWAVFLAVLTPFLFFHNRLAITDALLFCNLSIAYYFSLKINDKHSLWSNLALALFFFLSIMSKTPALLFMPIFYLTIFFEKKITRQKIASHTIKISLSMLLAALAFYSFRLVPLFSQLFAVGGNFLQNRETVFSLEIFSIASNNALFFLNNLYIYLGPAILILSLPFFAKTRRKQSVLLLSGLLFLLPLILLGKIIYSRYALPSSLFFISSAAITLNNLKNKKLLRYFLLLSIILPSLLFIKNAYFKPDQLSLSKADRTQYLEEWSSGHGILETVQLITSLAQNKTVAVATEGYFGSLPDGILLNLHNQNVENIYVEGIGQPVREIPDFFRERAKNFEIKLLVVNSHRLKMDTSSSKLLASFCRPNQAPCLQVWQLEN